MADHQVGQWACMLARYNFMSPRQQQRWQQLDFSLPNSRGKRTEKLALADLPISSLDALLFVLQEEPCSWAAAAASCKALYQASKATLPLPLLIVSPATTRAARSRARRSNEQCPASLWGLLQALEFRRGRGDGCFCRKLVVNQGSLPSGCLGGVLQALAGQALPEELEIHGLGRWTDMVQAGLRGLTSLRQLRLQLQSSPYKAKSWLNLGILSSLQLLKDLEVEIRASHPDVSWERVPLASLTRLSLLHAPAEGQSLVDHKKGKSLAFIDPAVLPALRLLQLGRWSQLTVVEVAVSDSQEEVAGAWRVPEVELRGPTEDCTAVGLAPLALSVEAHLKLPELAYSHLTRLRIDRVCRIQGTRDDDVPSMPSMPRLAELHLGQGVGVKVLEGPDAGRQEADLLIAACPTLTQVTGREDMLSYEQLKEAGGLGDMTELTHMQIETAEPPPDISYPDDALPQYYELPDESPSDSDAWTSEGEFKDY